MEVIQELVSLSSAVLMTMNGDGETSLVATILTSSLKNIPEYDMKLRVLLEAAPQAAKIASLSLDNDLFHRI